MVWVRFMLALGVLRERYIRQGDTAGGSDAELSLSKEQLQAMEREISTQVEAARNAKVQGFLEVTYHLL